MNYNNDELMQAIINVLADMHEELEVSQNNIIDYNVYNNGIYNYSNEYNYVSNGFMNELEQHSTLLNQSLYERSPIIRVVPDEILEQLPRIYYKDCNNPDQNKMCAITYEEFAGDSIIIQLPCNHCFFADPIINWLSQNSCECPVCRFAMESVEKNNTNVHNNGLYNIGENNSDGLVNNVAVWDNSEWIDIDSGGINIIAFLDSLD